MSKAKPEKKKMATSREVYDRIIWDARLDQTAFVLGYSERTSSDGIREKPLSQWDTDGDIPWHRVRYIRCQEIIVWDRDQHLDLFSTGQLPAGVWATSTQEEATPPVSNPDNLLGFSARVVHQYSLQGWQPHDQLCDSITLGTLTIASFNVLCDMHEADRIQTARRIPAILEHLHHCDADIVALQEATPPLLEALLEQDWTRSYFVSESPEGSTLKPYGLLLLSRLPFTLVEHQFSAHKRVLVGTWQINHQPLHLAVVHLPSNRAHNAVALRTHQLNGLLNYLKTQVGDCLIVGDFNTRGNELGEELTQSCFVDVWQRLHPDAEGYTFDPNRNPLAALMSLHKEAARFDRILLQSEQEEWVPQAIELFACEPLPGTEGELYASDHFGVRAVLKSSPQLSDTLRTVPPVYQSAVVVIPPTEVWPAVQALRRRYDRKVDRWMPHITLLYGFVPEEYFEEAAPVIAQALAELQPFEIQLAGFETFTHRKSCTAWLRPIAQPPDALHQLQAILHQLFPQCDEQSTKSPAGFTPHLSVGQFSSEKEALTQLTNWHPVSFPVEAVALISRRGDQPFEVRHWVHLGQVNKGGEGVSSASTPNLIQLINRLEPPLSQAQQAHRETVLAVVKQACAECLGQQPSLHLLGSARLGVQSLQSDLDVVCLIPNYLAGEAFLENVRQRLEGLCERAQLVLDARVPVLRMELEGVSLDLLYARSSLELSTLDQLTQDTKLSFDPISWKAVVGCLEADILMDVVHPHVPLASLRKLLQAVRAWAKARQIHGNAWGFLGNFSWALLAAWSCTHYSQGSADIQLEALFANFFQILAQHDWKQPIALTSVGREYVPRLPQDWLPVVTSIAPCQNSARNVSRSTAQILCREFLRGAELIERVTAGEIGWDALFESAELPAQSEQFLVLTATSQDEDSLEKCCRWLEGYSIGLVIELERLNVSVRPWPKIHRGQNTGSVVLGVELPQDFNPDTLQLMGKDFLEQFNTLDAGSHKCKLESRMGDRQMLVQLRLN